MIIPCVFGCSSAVFSFESDPEYGSDREDLPQTLYSVYIVILCVFLVVSSAVFSFESDPEYGSDGEDLPQLSSYSPPTTSQQNNTLHSLPPQATDR